MLSRIKFKNKIYQSQTNLAKNFNVSIKRLFRGFRSSSRILKAWVSLSLLISSSKTEIDISGALVHWWRCFECNNIALKLNTLDKTCSDQSSPSSRAWKPFRAWTGAGAGREFAAGCARCTWSRGRLCALETACLKKYYDVILSGNIWFWKWQNYIVVLASVAVLQRKV